MQEAGRTVLVLLCAQLIILVAQYALTHSTTASEKRQRSCAEQNCLCALHHIKTAAACIDNKYTLDE